MLVKLSLKQYALAVLIWSGAVAVILGGTLVMASNAKAEHELVWGIGTDQSDWQDCQAREKGFVLTLASAASGG